jgi:hypothetical protein
LLVVVGCSQTVEISAVETEIPTSTPFQPLIRKSTPTPTPIPPPTLNEVLRIGNPVKVGLNSESLRELEIVDCERCESSKIDKLLGAAKAERWVGVRDEYENLNVIYVHSSTQPWGDHLGQIFIEMYKDDTLKGTEICLNNHCYIIDEAILLGKKEVGDTIPVKELLENNKNNSIIWVTCYGNLSFRGGRDTPKLIVISSPH